MGKAASPVHVGGILLLLQRQRISGNSSEILNARTHVEGLHVFISTSQKARHELLTFFSNKRLDVQNWIKKGWLGTVLVQIRGSTGLDSSVVGIPVA